VVARGARIAVFTFPRIKGLVAASVHTFAQILGTLDTVVTQWHGDPALISRFVNCAVAIVVGAIADLRRWSRGIAIGKADGGTDSLACTSAELIGFDAGCGQPQFNRCGGAGTRTGVGNALYEFDSIYSDFR